MRWPYKRTVMISRCFWDYYLHVFQKDYAYELKNSHDSDVIWVDRPTRHPMVWFKERRRIIDGITVLRPWSLRNEYEKFQSIDRKLFDLQISKYLRVNDSLCLWSICCMHPWLTKTDSFSHTIYWPGDHFDPKEEYSYYKDYDLVMPWVGIDDMPANFRGKKFLSSTCAGDEFMNFKGNRLLEKRFVSLTQFKNKVSYIGGLSWERFDFELLHKVANALPDTVFLLGVKSDGMDKTEEAKTALLKKCSNIRVWEDLNYEELAELVFQSDLGMIPYKVSGQNLRICPNKFFEYSALGRRTITTAIPSMSRYSPPAHIALTHQEFISLIKEQLNHSIDENSKINLRKISVQASAKETLIRIANVLTNN
jgi:hypothetical protein